MEKKTNKYVFLEKKFQDKPDYGSYGRKIHLQPIPYTYNQYNLSETWIG